MSHTAELIAVGTELLLGNIANTDAQMLSEGLSTLGITVHYHTVVGDNPTRLKEALEIARKRADIIITTGGLGPTYDDLTKQTIAEAFGRKLVLHEDILEEIRGYFEKKRGQKMPENNTQQAMLPEGCTVFTNPVGTAPGCAIEQDGTYVLMLPGPPFECRYMFENRAVPYLMGLTDGVIVSHNLRIFGMGESAVDEKVHDLTACANPTLAPYAKVGECMLRATAKAETAEKAEKMLRPLMDEVKNRLGDVVYGVDVESMDEVVTTILKERGLTISAAESCTGGLFSKHMTDLPGSSAYFRGGVVSYATDLKHSIIGVKNETLEQFGAVSEEAAREMAEGCRKVCASDLAIAITGVAGPDKDERGNDVGTVYIALAHEGGTICKKVLAGLGRGRGRIRSGAVQHTFDLLRRFLLELPLN